jgi:outer membrane protein assembly factor BamB
MSPEQAQGQPTGPASDVFSLGGVVYFAATGSGPFGPGTPATVLYRIVHTEPDLTRLPPKVRDLVAACLAKDPARRPTPASLAASLMGALPPEDSPPAFWPAPVAQLIADHQARFAAGLMNGESSSAEAVAASAAPATPPLPAAGTTRAEVAPGDQTLPVPGMGRRRALAALAGMATAGLVVAGWELTRPGPAAAKSVLTAADLAAQRRITAAPPGTKIWSFKTNGTVASVAVAGAVVYAGTQEHAVYALDALTGRPLWRHLMDNGKTHSLATASGAVIAADGYNGVEPTYFVGGVYALDPETGKLLWSVKDLFTAAVAVAGDVVYAGVAIRDDLTGGVTALSAGTGELLWTFDFPPTVDANGGLSVADGVVYATTARGEIFALSPSSGDVLWRVANPAITFSTFPEVANGVVFVTSGHDKQDGSSPVQYAVDARTGHVLWQHPLGTASSAFCVTDTHGVVFAAVIRDLTSTRPGASEVYALNAVSGQQLWQIPVTGAIYAMSSSPGNNVVYTGNNSGVLDAWQADTGNHLWSYRAGGAFSSDILFQDGIAYFGGTDQRIYAVAVHA